MAISVLLRDKPHRSIALVTASIALIFRHTPSTVESQANGSAAGAQSAHVTPSNPERSAPRCIAELSQADGVDLSDYRSLAPTPVYGTLGLITVDQHVFLCVVSAASRVATLRPGETVQRINAVDFYCLNSPEYDQVTLDDFDYYQTEDSSREGYEHPCLQLKKLLSGGTFYYSTDFDLTNRLQDRAAEQSVFEISSLDEGFLWNSYMIGPLLKFRSHISITERDALDRSQILTSAIRGFAMSIAIPSSTAPIPGPAAGLPSTITLISRLSCRRAGTRFNARGIDDDGNVANFVETETIYWSPTGICFSYAQIRGSVPIFWEQSTGLLPGQQKITVTRSPEATQPAFDKHFETLEVDYGSIHILNLLSESKPGEAELTDRYRRHVYHSPLNRESEKSSGDHQLLKQTDYDFHAETKGLGYEAATLVRNWIEPAARGFAYYLSEEVDDSNTESTRKASPPQQRSVVVLQQEGVFRTNCLDCLDRTNLVQTTVSQMAIELFLRQSDRQASGDFWMRHNTLWADNGDALSKIYAGTGALKSSFTRHGKLSLAGALADARKSATRVYINNFADKGRQNTMDMLLGRLMGQTPVHLYDPINDYVTAELGKRSREFSASRTIGIWAGTFNLNGKATGLDEDLSPWLCSDLAESHQDPEIVAVGFQEIVELSPQQIMSTDPRIRQAWDSAVKETLNRHAETRGTEKYVLLRGGQLVGAALSIFVKESVLPSIKNVEGSVKKTGLSGMAGNKGAVAIRMDFAATRLCFVTAHLAAGFANYEERNRDYQTISHGLRFQRNRAIEDHDSVIWLGDFNYRIGLSDDKVRKLVQSGNLETLYENDQLNLQMVAGLTFPYYSEARITFPPTYKYDTGSDTYDTSEKSRIPAWCDRILRKGTNLRQLSYEAAPLRFSDHRPVYASFQCVVTVIDEAKKGSMTRTIYERRREELGGSLANTKSDDTDDEEVIGYDAISPGLPPASSDRRKWWLDNGLPVRAIVKPPQGMRPNPHRSSNPFSLSNQSDWVDARRSSRQADMDQRPGAIGASRPQTSKVLDQSARATATSPPLTQSPRRDRPPVPRKPVRLGSESSKSVVDQKRGPNRGMDASPPPVALPPGPFRRNANEGRIEDLKVGRMQGRLPDAGMERENKERGPSLPPRPANGMVKNGVVPQSWSSNAPKDLLNEADPGATNLDSWKPLKPS